MSSKKPTKPLDEIQDYCIILDNGILNYGEGLVSGKDELVSVIESYLDNSGTVDAYDIDIYVKTPLRVKITRTVELIEE